MNNKIKNEEDLFRRVDVRPQFWKEDVNRPSSALFKDSNGVSVDRSNGRVLSDVITDEERLHQKFGKEKLKAIISVSKKICDAKELYIKFDPISDNKYHCIVQKSESSTSLTSSQAKFLSKNCVINKYYA